LLNPLSNRMQHTMKALLEQKVQSFLIDEDYIAELYKETFVDEVYLPAERTMHKAIPPANIRIKDFDRKKLN
jgi:hypothetical protein